MPLQQINFDFGNLIPNKEEAEKPSIQAKEIVKLKRGRKSLKKIAEEPITIEVPEDDILFQKSYYPIGEVAAMFKENISLVRFWENEFRVLQPKKNKKGDRFFRPEDIKNLKLIHYLLRERKFTLEGAKEYLKNNKAAGEKLEMIESLEKVKLFLLELKNNL